MEAPPPQAVEKKPNKIYTQLDTVALEIAQENAQEYVCIPD